MDITERGTRTQYSLMSLTGQTVGTINGSAFQVTEAPALGDILLRLLGDLTAGVGDTLDVVVQDSVDGSTWQTLATFAQLVADGQEFLELTRAPGPQIRVQAAIVGTGSWDIDVDLVGRLTVTS